MLRKLPLIAVALALVFGGLNTDKVISELDRFGIDVRPVIEAITNQTQTKPTAQKNAPVKDLGAGQPYVRSFYGDGWLDYSGDCLNTRQEVLVATSTVPVTMRKSGCSVEHGKWFDPYSGQTFTQASQLDIDHLVPLAWAHAHGADAWDADTKMRFANWEPNLFPVKASVNREKGAKGPLQWLPPRVEYRCEYIVRFERVVLTWKLSLSPKEKSGFDELKAHYCPSSTK